MESQIDKLGLSISALVLSAYCCAAVAADLSQGIGRVAQGALRDLQRHATTRLISLTKPTPPAAPDIDLTLGVSYDRLEDSGHVWSTPFEFNYQPSESKWKFTVQGAGFTRNVEADGTRSSGLADVTALANYTLAVASDGKWLVVGSAGYSVPTHGEVGSTSGTVLGRFIGVLKLTPVWTTTLALIAARSGSVPAPASRDSQVLHGELQYNFANDVDIALKFERSQNSGLGGTSEAIAALDFPIASKLTGSLSVNRGFTRGSRDRGIEFDISKKF
jgi:hypothetical protein